jgi:SAM-dependent MidA family methyltransferase
VHFRDNSHRQTQTTPDCLPHGSIPQRSRRNDTRQCAGTFADPFLWPGLQDITALAEAGVAAGLEVLGYTNQTYFLLDCGLDRLLLAAGPTDSPAYLRLAREAKTLILPGEMGERFKCLGLGRGLEQPLPGFRSHDFRYRL